MSCEQKLAGFMASTGPRRNHGETTQHNDALLDGQETLRLPRYDGCTFASRRRDPPILALSPGGSGVSAACFGPRWLYCPFWAATEH